MFGNVIIGMFPNAPSELVDGLQRFATGTVLLNTLYSRTLSPTPSNVAASTYFVRLKTAAAGYQPVFVHNHAQLLNHPREAIRTQYATLRDEVEAGIDEHISPTKVAVFAQQVNATFLDKQVAIDEYWNFQSVIELANTFIGLNTVRVELGTVDLIRAYVVDKASSTAPPWPTGDIAEVENDITDTFVVSGAPRREFLAAATVILKALRSVGSLRPTHAFPSWPAITKAEIDRLLDFLDQVRTCPNRYVREIAECGSVPFGVLILFYYREFLRSGAAPQFLSGSNADDPDLHMFLRAAYRALVDGSIGQLGSLAERALEGNYAALADVAAAMSPTSSGALTAPPPADWLRASLASIDAKKGRRVFNACLLPDRTTAGGPFTPLTYGRSSQNWQIDHLIPYKNLQKTQPGYREGATLRNFSPLPARLNRLASNTPCSQKLSGMYATSIQQAATSHPYMVWLTNNQAQMAGQLDDQQLLEPNANPSIGDARIGALVTLLTPKL